MTNIIDDRVDIVELPSRVKTGERFTLEVEYDASAGDTLRFSVSSGYFITPETIDVPPGVNKRVRRNEFVIRGSPRSDVEVACTLRGASDQQRLEVQA